MWISEPLSHQFSNRCPFPSLRDYYVDSLHVIFAQFPNYFLQFPIVLSHFSPSVCTISFGFFLLFSTVFPSFSLLDFAVKKRQDGS